jgi:two-component system, LytTR family, response regulator LytT
MTILIIEDESLAARKLQKLVKDIDATAEIVGMTDSIESSVEWLENHDAPDLILMDIELADGQSFEIFNQTEVTSTIIFTTAYDEYALKAFKVNSIDYLLKPVRLEDMQKALDKFKRLSGKQTPETAEKPSDNRLNIEALLKELRQTKPQEAYRERFLIKHGQRFITVETTDIAYFYTEDRVNFVKTKSNQKYIVDYTLDEMEKLIDPRLFFRANRQFIIGVKAIDSIHPYFNNKLKLHLKPTIDVEVLISREKANEFKAWMGA